MDEERLYPERSFCLLETYATIVAGHTLRLRERDECECCHPWTWCCCVQCLPCYDHGFSGTVNSGDAQCRSQSDKITIDEYIVSNVDGGHATVNAVMEREMTRGALQLNRTRFLITCCCPCFLCCQLLRQSPRCAVCVPDACGSYVI